MEDDQQFCLRWNNHQSTLIQNFDTLLESGTLVDCTLAAEGKYLKAHKVVLSACSPYFEGLLSEHYDKHPVFILKDVKFKELKAMMDYMYRGEVNISQDQLTALLKAAESLQIKGLSDSRTGGGAAGGSATSSSKTETRSAKAASSTAATSSSLDIPHASSGLTIEKNSKVPRQSLQQVSVSDLPEDSASPQLRGLSSREGSQSPTSRKRLRKRKRSVNNDDTNSMENHEASNSSDVNISAPALGVAPVATEEKSHADPAETIGRSALMQQLTKPADEMLQIPIEKPEPSEEMIQPKSEYLDDQDDVEDLTNLDDDMNDLNEMEQDNSRAGPSHDPSQHGGIASWHISGDRSNASVVGAAAGPPGQQDEVFLAAHEAAQAQRDSQDVGSPILSTTTKRKKTVKETSTIESDADSGQDSQNVYIKEEFNCSSDNDEPFDIISAVGTWMPLFKVVLPGSKSKKYIVKTNSVSDIINKTKVKFSLPDDEYKLVLEDSNCEIEDDDILLEYAKEYAIQNKSPMTLTLMPQWWNAVASTSAFNYNQESTPFIPQTQTQSFPGMKLDQQAINLENVWNKVPKRLLAACQNKKQPLPIDRLTMVRYIVDYMMFELKSTTRHTAETIAKMICTAYPESFADTIDGQIIGKGMENLRQQIYNAVKYRKKSRQDQNFMKKAADESDDKASEKKKSYYQDKQYGCVSYAPSLPRNETEKSQEQKRIRLLQLYMAGQKNNIFEISKLMLETYATQRARINDDDRCLSLIFHDWPFLKDSEYLTKHSSILLGNDIPKTWQESLEIKFTQIRKFFSRKENFKGKEEQVANIMKEAEKACSTSKNSNQETLMMFPLIVLQFAESQDKLYQIVKGKIEDVDLINDSNLELNHPVLIIRGKSLYDEKAICSVLTEKQLISCTDALDGILVTFLCYYVFGYYYPKEVARTLEFLQRVILGINPTKGSKKIAKGRSTERSFDSMVFKFAKQLNDFKN